MIQDTKINLKFELKCNRKLGKKYINLQIVLIKSYTGPNTDSKPVNQFSLIETQQYSKFDSSSHFF